MEGETQTQNKEGTEQKGAAEDSGAGSQPEESKAVVKLRKENERLETQLSKKKQLLAEQKEIEARESLGGGSEAGRPTEKKKETPQEYVKREFAWMK